MGLDLLANLSRLTVLAAQGYLFLAARRLLARRPGRWRRLAPWAALGAGLLLTAVSGLFQLDERFLGARAGAPWPAVSAVWAAGSAGLFLVSLVLQGWRWLQRRTSAGTRLLVEGPVNPGRRQLAANMGGLALTAPFAVAFYGTFIGRRRFEVREVELAFENLPPDLDGLRIAQLTDVHYGPYLNRADLETVAGMANELKPDLVALTGDFITTGADPLEECIGVLAGVRATAGLWGCLGNHEIYAQCEDHAAAYAGTKGVRILRHQRETLRFGKARLNLCGVDYQRKGRPYLAGAERMVRPEDFNVLLSHNPDVFPEAAGMGYDLVVSGHTHGGQITVEIAEQWANAARFMTPFVKGEYRRGASAVYVSAGIGTVFLPYASAHCPEVTLLKLRRA